MCEPRLGILIQGAISLGLPSTKGRFFSRSCRVHPMKLSRGASFHRRWRSRAWRAASRRGRGRRSASGRRPGSCIRDSGSGRRTRSRACSPGCRARRGAGRGADLVEGRRGREQRRFGVRPEDDRPGPVLPSLRRGRAIRPSLCMASIDPGHHFLEFAVGLEPADAPAELLRQHMAVRWRRYRRSARAAAPFPRR